MVKRILALLLAPIVGGLVGFGLAYLLFSGWLRGWQPVADPPEKIAHILALNGDDVWVKAVSGTIYNNPHASTCTDNCWTAVQAVPSEFPPEMDLSRRDPQTCMTPPPIWGVVERKGDCKVHMWYDENTIFALRTNGRLTMWNYGSGGEWTGVGFLFLIASGALLFFIITALVILINWLARRLRERNAVNQPTPPAG